MHLVCQLSRYEKQRGGFIRKNRETPRRNAPAQAVGEPVRRV